MLYEHSLPWVRLFVQFTEWYVFFPGKQVLLQGAQTWHYLIWIPFISLFTLFFCCLVMLVSSVHALDGRQHIIVECQCCQKMRVENWMTRKRKMKGYLLPYPPPPMNPFCPRGRLLAGVWDMHGLIVMWVRRLEQVFVYIELNEKNWPSYLYSVHISLHGLPFLIEFGHI